MSPFEIKAKDGLARLGRLTTRHGTVKTPLLMPVVHPGKSVITPRELLDEFGFQMVITNSYIIKSHERFRTKALKDGVHGLIGADCPVMTDSGTFQMYTHDLPEEEIDALEIVRFQREIGSDIGTILDVFSAPDVGKSQAEKDVEISLERARISVAEKGDMMLAGTVQGSFYKELRELSAQKLALLDIDVHPIGGTVPLMEQYRFADIVGAVLASKKHLPPDRPVHLFGCGHPMFFALAALLGCDLFDSASYAKFAESDKMLMPTGTIHVDALSELPCYCPACTSIDIEQLKSMSKNDRELVLMRHNLYISAAEMRKVRQAIQDEKLFELAAVRSRVHPTLYDAYNAMLRAYDQLEQSDPVGKSSSIFYTGPETVMLPAIRRFHARLLERYPFRLTSSLLLVPHLADRPFSDTATVVVKEVKKRTPEELILFFVTPFGIVPWELEHVHPVQQCLFPKDLDMVTLGTVKQRVTEILSQISFKQCLWMTRDVVIDSIFDDLSNLFTIQRATNTIEIEKRLQPISDNHTKWQERKLAALLSYEWNLPIDSFAKLGEVEISVSRNTGKIRHVQREGKILFTLVPTTGLLTPTYEGGLELMHLGLPEDYIVTMNEDAAEFIVEGKSALAKFVVQASPRLRAGDEVLLFDIHSNLLGVGKAVLNGTEMLAFKRGVAVNTRHARGS